MSHSGGRTDRTGEEYISGDLPSPSDRRAASAPHSAFSFEHAAAELHASNRRRADLFKHPIMADSPMAVMLTALIAEEQGTPLTRVATAMANRLDFPAAERIIGDLIDARLLETRTGDKIGLTSLGAGQMRSYVSRARGAA